MTDVFSTEPKQVEVASETLTENVILEHEDKEFMYIGNKLYRVADIQSILDARIPEVVVEEE